ncbi:MAG TPA: hypothetical protein DDW65_08250 [Firmicutes bacterium]|nr:hypothetical protein [Bacillota bacterium]
MLLMIDDLVCHIFQYSFFLHQLLRNHKKLKANLNNIHTPVCNIIDRLLNWIITGLLTWRLRYYLTPKQFNYN